MVYNNFDPAPSGMDGRTAVKVALDSCVVIDVLNGRHAAVASALKGERVVLVLCETVLREVRRVRGVEPGETARLVGARLGRRVETVGSTPGHRTVARSLSCRLLHCHAGDDMIVAACIDLSCILITSDRKLLDVCGMVGVTARRPRGRRGR